MEVPLLIAAWASASACAWSLGRAPIVEQVYLAPVVAPVAEEGLARDLTAALGRELDRLDAGGGGLPLTVSVEAAEVRSVALGAAAQEVELALAFELDGQRVTARGRRAFALSPGDPAATAAARAAAFEALSEELAADGLARLLGSAP